MTLVSLERAPTDKMILIHKCSKQKKTLINIYSADLSPKSVQKPNQVIIFLSLIWFSLFMTWEQVRKVFQIPERLLLEHWFVPPLHLVKNKEYVLNDIGKLRIIVHLFWVDKQRSRGPPASQGFCTRLKVHQLYIIIWSVSQIKFLFT